MPSCNSKVYDDFVNAFMQIYTLRRLRRSESAQKNIINRRQCLNSPQNHDSLYGQAVKTRGYFNEHIGKIDLKLTVPIVTMLQCLESPISVQAVPVERPSTIRTIRTIRTWRYKSATECQTEKKKTMTRGLHQLEICGRKRTRQAEYDITCACHNLRQCI